MGVRIDYYTPSAALRKQNKTETHIHTRIYILYVHVTYVCVRIYCTLGVRACVHGRDLCGVSRFIGRCSVKRSYRTQYCRSPHDVRAGFFNNGIVPRLKNKFGKNNERTNFFLIPPAASIRPRRRRPNGVPIHCMYYAHIRRYIYLYVWGISFAHHFSYVRSYQGIKTLLL